MNEPIQNCCSLIRNKDIHSKEDIIVKSISITNCYENKIRIPKEKSNSIEASDNSEKNINIINNISNNHDKIIDLIPLKSIPDLFINFEIVQIDENGLTNNLKNSKYNKVIFKTIQENYSPSNGNFLTTDNNNHNENNKIEKNEIDNENNINNNEINTVFISNKIEPKLNKSLSLFSIEYNKTSNNYILTSLTDEIYFSLEIWSNKNFYLENLKRYYLQLSNIIISIFPNNIDRNITIKLLNINNGDKNKNKYNFDCKVLPIKIGRSDCNININKESISKVHLIIDYDININKFFIRDNYSTNGSLILLKKGKDIELKDKMFFFLEKVHFILKRQ